MEQFEVKFEQYDSIYQRHEVRYDYFYASTEESARRQCYHAYGDLIDILHVTAEV